MEEKRPPQQSKLLSSLAVIHLTIVLSTIEPNSVRPNLQQSFQNVQTQASKVRMHQFILTVGSRSGANQNSTISTDGLITYGPRQNAWNNFSKDETTEKGATEKVKTEKDTTENETMEKVKMEKGATEKVKKENDTTENETMEKVKTENDTTENETMEKIKTEKDASENETTEKDTTENLR
ncbi:hypothetical protein MANI_025543 [Metarhizium anisopliae]|nr:hypothetical protein MANI_025543 [Metarhizium anisopliae]